MRGVTTSPDYRIANPRKSAADPRKFVGEAPERKGSKAARTHSLNQRKDWIKAKQQPADAAATRSSSTSSSAEEDAPPSPGRIGGARSKADTALANLAALVQLTDEHKQVIRDAPRMMKCLERLSKGQFDRNASAQKTGSKFLRSAPPIALIHELAACGLGEVAADLIARCPKAQVVMYATDLLSEPGLPAELETAIAKCVDRAERQLNRMEPFKLKSHLDGPAQMFHQAKQNRYLAAVQAPIRRFDGDDALGIARPWRGTPALENALQSLEAVDFDVGAGKTKAEFEEHVRAQLAGATGDKLAALCILAMKTGVHDSQQLDFLKQSAPLALEFLAELLRGYCSGTAEAKQALSKLMPPGTEPLTGHETPKQLKNVLALALALAKHDKLPDAIAKLVDGLHGKPELLTHLLRTLAVGNEYEVVVKAAMAYKEHGSDGEEMRAFVLDLGGSYPLTPAVLKTLAAGLKEPTHASKPALVTTISTFVEGRLRRLAELAKDEGSYWKDFNQQLVDAKPLLMKEAYRELKKMRPA